VKHMKLRAKRSLDLIEKVSLSERAIRRGFLRSRGGWIVSAQNGFSESYVMQWAEDRWIGRTMEPAGLLGSKGSTFGD